MGKPTERVYAEAELAEQLQTHRLEGWKAAGCAASTSPTAGR
jgi:hypothetical protein